MPLITYALFNEDNLRELIYTKYNSVNTIIPASTVLDVFFLSHVHLYIFVGILFLDVLDTLSNMRISFNDHSL